MNLTEFSNQFDVLYNNITSNQAPGLNEYEKSLFLTKSQDEIIKNYFTANSKGNNIGQGFDDSAKRQADFSVLMKTASCVPSIVSSTESGTRLKYTCSYEIASGIYTSSVRYDIYFTSIETGNRVVPTASSTPLTVNMPTLGTNYFTSNINSHPVYVHNWPYRLGGSILVESETVVLLTGRIDERSFVYEFPSDVFIVINESYTLDSSTSSIGKYQIIPLRYDEYTRLMSKPYKRPLKNQAWRLINSGSVSGNDYNKYVEIITPPGVSGGTYNIRYIRRPHPIIIGDLDGLTIGGFEYNASNECELDPILHEDILQRAVELAKVAWTATGNDNAQMVLQAGQRSE